MANSRSSVRLSAGVVPSSPETLNEERRKFSLLWLSTPRQERHTLLRRLTRADPKRSWVTMQLGHSRISLDAVLLLLGEPDW